MAGSERAQTAQTGSYEHSHDASPSSNSKDEVAVPVERDEEKEANEQNPDHSPVKTSSPSSAPHQPVSLLDLPNELLEQIFGFIQDTKAHLAQLCLACRPLLPMARSVLYSSIEFNFSQYTCSDFEYLGDTDFWVQKPLHHALFASLASNPHLATLVRSFDSYASASPRSRDWSSYDSDVRFDNFPTPEDDDRATVEAFSTKEGVDPAARCQALLSMLPNLQELNMHLLDYPEYVTDDLSVLVLPTVTRLDVFWSFPSLPRSFPSLSELTWSDQNTVDASAPPPNSLKRLDVSTAHYLRTADLEWLISASLSSLSHLSVYIGNALAIEPILPRLSQLRHLSLEGWIAPPLGFPLTRLPTLPASVRALTLDTNAPNEAVLTGFSSPTLRTLILSTGPVPPSIYLGLFAPSTFLPALGVLDMRSVRACKGPEWDETASKLLEAGEERGIGVLLPRARAYPFYELPGPYDL